MNPLVEPTGICSSSLAITPEKWTVVQACPAWFTSQREDVAGRSSSSRTHRCRSGSSIVTRPGFRLLLAAETEP